MNILILEPGYCKTCNNTILGFGKLKIYTVKCDRKFR